MQHARFYKWQCYYANLPALLLPSFVLHPGILFYIILFFYIDILQGCTDGSVHGFDLKAAASAAHSSNQGMCVFMCVSVCECMCVSVCVCVFVCVSVCVHVHV